MKPVFFYGYRADILGLFLLALALFCVLALSSYYPLDPSFNSLGLTDTVKNQCGYLGSFLADILYQLFGWSAWLFVLAFFKYSLLAFQRKIFVHGGFLKDLTLFGLTVLVVSSLFELHLPEKKFFQGHIASGGLMGGVFVRQSLPYFHFSGLFLTLWSSVLMLLMIYTKSSLSVVLGQSVFFVSKPFLSLKIFLSERVFQILPSPLSFKKWFSIKGFKTSKDAEDKESSFDLKGDSYEFLEEEDTEVLKEGDLSPSAKTEPWLKPPLDLLKAPSLLSLKVRDEEISLDAQRLLNKLKQFSISGKIVSTKSGPAITLFEFKPEDHVKVARISQMEDDLMMALKSESIRIIAPIPGKDVVGIETAHSRRQTVFLKHLLKDPDFLKDKNNIPLVLGSATDGRTAIVDLKKIPHLMVAGSTGSGKSVFVSSFLISLLFRYTPREMRLLLVDPKQVELSAFNELPHLLTPPVKDSRQVVLALQWCVAEMNKRYRSLAQFHVKNLKDFNDTTLKLTSVEQKSHEESLKSLNEEAQESYYFSPQPYICIVLEEFGDLMSSPERMHIENLVVRLAQMARACGIHLILAMQSPRKDVVTGLIKTNIPGRMSFKVSSRVDSRIILDEGGAERLLSQGDMLYLGPGQAHPERYHGPFVKEKEIQAVVDFWKKQNPHLCPPLILDKVQSSSVSPSTYLTDEEDQKYAQICRYISSELKEVSASYLQRKYSLGYPRAARLMDRLEQEGVIGPAQGSKPRKVLIQK